MYVSGSPVRYVLDDPLNRLRILYMPAVFSLVSFLSFHYYDGYTYFSLIDSGKLASCSGYHVS